MTAALLTLGLAYVFLLLLVLLAVLKSEIGAGSKLALVTLCLGFYLWHYDSLQKYLGWPAGDGLPQKFELVSSYTVEPDLKRDQAGSIYVWVRTFDEDFPVPRAHRLPYHKQLHRQLDDTLQRQRQGERFVGRPAAARAGNRSPIEFEAVQRDSEAHKTKLAQ